MNLAQHDLDCTFHIPHSTLLTPVSNSPEDGFGLGHGQSSQSPAVHVDDLVPDEEAPVSAKASCMSYAQK